MTPRGPREPGSCRRSVARRAVRALVVDDDPGSGHSLAFHLETLGCEVTSAPTAQAAAEANRTEAFEIAFCALELGAEGSGLDLVSLLLAQRPRLNVVVVAASASLETVVEAMNRGARDYLPNPPALREVRALVTHELERLEQEEESSVFQNRLEEVASREMQAALAAVASQPIVLLRGEPGTGKETLARAIHAMGAGSSGPFLTIDCRRPAASVVAEIGTHAGWSAQLAAAQGGTLFLDGIDSLGSKAQASLLQVLMERGLHRTRQDETRPREVRIVASTNGELEGKARAGVFGSDLFEILASRELFIPPLRARYQEIVPLAQSMVASFARKAGSPCPKFSVAARRALVCWPWPANVRELRDVIERAFLSSAEDLILPSAFPARMALGRRLPALGESFTLEEVEREHVQRVLAWAPTRVEASRLLGISTEALKRKLKRWEQVPAPPDQSGRTEVQAEQTEPSKSTAIAPPRSWPLEDAHPS